VIIDRPDPGTAGVQSPRPAVDSAEARRRLEEESVGIADCQRVSQDLSALLDVEEDDLEAAALGNAYTLEVSSPGLDRPLRNEADYRRFKGRLAKVVTSEPVNGQSAFAGRLAGVEDGTVLLEEGRKVHRVPLARIKRARLEVEF
jgi:ribosome maturation factor RimP